MQYVSVAIVSRCVSRGLFFYCLLSILSPVIFVLDPLFAECRGFLSIFLQIPFAEDANQRNIGPRRPYLERINIAYEFASAELLNLIIHKVI